MNSISKIITAFALFYALFLPKQLSSQCDDLIFAGQDFYICHPAEETTIDLNGYISGDWISFEWSPTALVQDPYRLNTEATITENTLFELTGFFVTDNNLVTNPSFEDRLNGYSNDPAYDSGYFSNGTIRTGQGIGANGSNSYLFQNTHCPGTFPAGSLIAGQTLDNILPGATYEACFWIFNANQINTALIEVRIGGQAVGIGGGGANGVWVQHCFTWTAGNVNTAFIGLYNLTGECYGNDFGVDELLLNEVCTASDDVMVLFDNTSIALELSETITCENPSVDINAVITSDDSNFDIEWTGADGNSINTNNTIIQVNEAGTYTINVYNPVSDCTYEAEIEVLIDTLSPIVNSSGPFEIFCEGNVVIDASDVVLNESETFEWSTVGGNIVSGEDGLIIEVDLAGEYILLVSNTDNGCTGDATFLVEQNNDVPTAFAQTDQVLNCNLASIVLDGSGSSEGSDFIYLWTSQDGNILNGEEDLFPEINEAGTYTLLVTNTVTGCSNQIDLEVEEDFALPTIENEEPQILTCIVEELTLSASLNNIENYQLEWSTIDGNFLSDEETLNPIINEAGTYTLIVTDLDNGCSDQIEINVFQNIVNPLIDAGPDGLLTCAETTLNLNGNSNLSQNISINWTTTGGNIIEGAQTLNPSINGAGTYLLTVTNELNGCSSTDEMLVAQDAQIPIADAGTEQELDCNIQSISLDASASSNGPQYEFLWSTNDGSIESGASSLNPIINAAGTYSLTVSNTANNCTAVSSVNIIENNIEPPIQFNETDELNCLNGLVILENLAVNPDSDFIFEWILPNGNTANSNVLAVSEAGVYVLNLINLENGCSSTQSIEVFENFEFPNIDAGPEGVLNCLESSITLNGSSDVNSSFDISWTTINGNIISGENSLNPSVNQEGIYTLTIVNLSNGCSAQSDVNVMQSTDLPNVLIESPEDLNCDRETLVISAENSSSGSSFEYLWTSANGQIISGAQTLNLEVGAAGIYELLITNTQNGCSAFAQVEVEENNIVPLASLAVDDILNCDNQTVFINSDLLNTSDVTFDWNSQNGNIVSSNNESSIEVNQAGTYFLEITYLENGCTNSFSIDVSQNEIAPVLSIEEPLPLNCETTNVSLNATASTESGNMELIWETIDGDILSGVNSLNPMVSQAGLYNLTVIDLDNGCSTSQSIEVIENNSLPTFEIEEPIILSCVVMAQDLQTTLDGALSDYELLWSSIDGNILAGSNTLNPSINQAGTYTLLITDLENACTATQSILVIEDLNVPDIDLNAEGLITCENQNINIESLGSSSGDSFQYTWSTLDGVILSELNSHDVQVASSGTYELSILNSENGCQSSMQIIIEDDFLSPTFNFINPALLTCETTETALQIEGLDPNISASFFWETKNGNIISSNTDPAIMINEAGTYTLTITNLSNGCTSLEEINVYIDNDVPVADAGNNLVLDCNNVKVELDGFSSSIGDEYEYNWTTENGNLLSPSNSINPLVDAAGTYVLTVLNTFNGCSAVSEVNVSEDFESPIITIAEPLILTCSTQSITLNALIENVGPEIEIIWSSTNGEITSTNNTEEIEVSTPGIYDINVLNSINGCVAMAQIEVFQNIEIPFVDAGESDLLTCEVTEITLNGIGPDGATFNFLWTSLDGNIINGATGLNPVVDQSGTYILQISNTINGCSSEDQVTVERYDNYPYGLEVEIIEPLCHGDVGSISILGVIGGDAPYLYSMDGFNFYELDYFEDLSPGSYNIIVQDANLCEYEEVVVIPSIPQIDVNLIPEVQLFLGEDYEMNPSLLNIPINEIESIIWSPSEGLSCDDCLNPVASPSEDITYTISITTENGCPASAEILLKLDRDVNIYIPNAFSPFVEDGINDVFMIYAQEGSIAKVATFQIYDRWGAKVFEENNFMANDPKFGWDGNYRGGKMNNGVFVYFAVIEFLDGRKELFKGDVTLIN